MKKLLCLAIATVFQSLSCFAQTFPVDTVTFHTKDSIVSATWYEGAFYGLSQQRNISRIDPTGKEEPFRSPRVWTETLFTRDGKLIAWEPLFSGYRMSTFIEYQYDGNSFRRKGRIKDTPQKIYEDPHFEVTASDSGEWGGTAYFTHKKSKKKYECRASSAIQVNRIGDSYTVTATCGHMFGSTQILEISDPTAMQPAKKRSRKRFGDYESKSTQGVTLLADSSGIQTLTSFVCQDKLYHLLSKGYDLSDDPPVTYVAITRNGAFEMIQKLGNFHLWRPDTSREIPYRDGYILAVREDDTHRPLLIGIENGRITFFCFEQIPL